MARKNRDTEVERLEKEVRDLKSLNRQLTKRLKKIDRQFRKNLELEEEELRKPPKREKIVPDCPACFKGNLMDIELGSKLLRKCNTCAYRKTQSL